MVEDVLDLSFSFAVSQAGPSEDRLPQWGEGIIYVKPEGLLLQHTSPNQVPRPEGRVKNEGQRASLLAQWLRIRLPMQETPVRALVQEDPTCHGATKPVRHND